MTPEFPIKARTDGAGLSHLWDAETRAVEALTAAHSTLTAAGDEPPC